MKTMQIIRRINFSEWGGTENVVWNSTRALIGSGVPSEILATSALGGASEETMDGVTIRRFGYFYPYFPLSAANKLALDKKGGNPVCFGMASYLRNHDFDLIHCHSAGRLAMIAAGAARRKKVPLVISLHGGWFDVPLREKIEMKRPLRHAVSYGGMIERLLRLRRDYMEQAAGIICVGANELDEVRLRYPNKMVRLLPNGVDVEKFSRPAAFNWRGELGIGKDTRILLNVSRIDYQKNQKLLVKMLAALKARGDKAHLLLIGPVTAEWYGRELVKLADELGVAKMMTLIPGMQPDDVRLPAAYQQADAFILPSLHEPFGIVALEAWSARLPVLAARVGGLRFLIKDGENGLQFDPEDVGTLLKAYDALPGCRDRLCEAAFKEVERNYSWQVVSGLLAGFYREVIDAESAVRR